MKNRYLLLLLLMPVYALRAQTPVVMNFDTIPSFSLTFGAWTVADLDQKPTYSIQNYSFPNQGDTMAFICFSPQNVTPPMTDSAIQPHSAPHFGACFSATTPPNNDWLISPQIQLGNGGSFTFWVKSYTDQYGLEKYNVAVSTTGNTPADFTVISGTTPQLAPVTWTQRTFNLSAYNGQAVYIAIQCVSSDAFIFMVDDMEIDPGIVGGLSANFTASETTITQGDSVFFTDLSTGNPTAWKWSFPGGTPSSSILQHPPYIIYNNPGTFDVKLVVSDTATSDSLLMPGFITVTPVLPTLVTQDFESVSDFSTVFTPWYTAYVNGGATWIINGVTFPKQGTAFAYINFNPFLTTPPVTNMQAHSGERFGACFSTMPPNNPNNKWLISPRMYLGTNPKIELWVSAYSADYGPELYNIGVSNTGTSPSSFNVINGSTPEQAPVGWTKRTYNLDSYSNQAVYVGIQCVSDNAFIFMIDDITISSTVGIHEQEQGMVSIYPNPASGHFFIAPDPAFSGTLRYTLTDLPGHVMRQELAHVMTGQPVPVETTGLKNGLYFLQITYDNKTLLRKIMVAR